jgi:hypothetical protein
MFSDRHLDRLSADAREPEPSCLALADPQDGGDLFISPRAHSV